MNFSLLNSILSSERAALVTILDTDGHTYKKAGHRAVYEVGAIGPRYGNLGSLCADQEILKSAELALNTGVPARISVDTRGENDGDLGYGTFCGGLMTLLIEPILDARKLVYRNLRDAVLARKRVFLSHDMQGGDLGLSLVRPESEPDLFIEEIAVLPRLFLFGATPLARQVLDLVKDLYLLPYVVDWREAFLEEIRDAHCIDTLLDSYPFEPDDLVVVLSHSFPRDRLALKHALQVECKYIGLLSSDPRRERMLKELQGFGIPAESIAQIQSPVGLALGGRTDAEIAIGIVAEIVRRLNP